MESPPLITPGTRFDLTPMDFVIAILGGFAGSLVAFLAFGNGGDAGVTLLAGLAGQYVGHLMALWAVMRRRATTLIDLGFEIEPIDGINLFLGAGLQIALAVLFLPLAFLLDQEGASQAVTGVLQESAGMGVRVALVVAIALVAPVTEELLFRGVLLRLIAARRSMRTAVLASSTVFALFHVLGVDAADPLRSAAFVVPQLFLVGLVLARQVDRRRRLGPAIFTHAGFNLVAVLALFAAVSVPS